MNSIKIQTHMKNIIASIDAGEANVQKTQRALAKAIELICADIIEVSTQSDKHENEIEAFYWESKTSKKSDGKESLDFFNDIFKK